MKYSPLAIALFLVSFGGSHYLNAQSDFYAIDHTPEIRLYFEQSNWDELLDSLYLLGEDYRLGADATIDGVAYDKVGVRYKGFSSYSSARNKNPLNIDLDYIFEEQEHQGYHKIKLSNVIQDPSFVREVLSYEVARKYMPASHANYANVYINDTLIGLYTNVEAVNGDFLEENFGSSYNTFVKGNPETIDLNGENANLSDSPGTDLLNYHALYNMKSTNANDWENLHEFIDVLNNDISAVESLLNIDRTLWMHAFNYSVINFDSYVGYAQNYYIFKDHNNQFNPILWDLNMSFASYRLTDASDNWDGFTIDEAKVIDPLGHLNSFSVQPRPLMRNLFETPMYERMYMAHLITIIEENFENGWYETQGAYIQSLIDGDVQADTNKFYSYNDFLENLDTTVSDLVDYPGIVELMDARSEYLMAYPGVQFRPDINNVSANNYSSSAGDDLWIDAEITGVVNNAFLAYRFGESETFTIVEMFDDGNNQDGAAGDDVYGALISNPSSLVQYYVYAENDSSGRFAPARAAYEFYEIQLYLRENDVVINEVMSENSFIRDEFGETDDWIEIMNPTAYSFSIAGLYLSNDESDLLKWSLPNQTLEADSYMTIWLDGAVQWPFHANFDIEAGDTLWISYGPGKVIDSVIVGNQFGVTSMARYPNGTGDFQELTPTFGTENLKLDKGLIDAAVFVYPNPAGQSFQVKTNQEVQCNVDLYSLDGRQLMYTKLLEGNETITIDSSDLADGIYLVSVGFGDERITKRVMITH